jgi:hypothetical protein
VREILVFGAKTFKIKVPDDAKVTFGPFSPPKSDRSNYGHEDSKRGTLRIYSGPTIASSMLAVFTHVDGFRDMSVEYAEEVAKEEGATIWKSDQHGYSRESKSSLVKEWVDDPIDHVVNKLK